VVSVISSLLTIAQPANASQGTICCRFPKESNELRNLGYIIKKHHFRTPPFFRVQYDALIVLTREITNRMVEKAEFSIDNVSVDLPAKNSPAVITFGWHDEVLNETIEAPISGFPRPLVLHDHVKRGKTILALNSNTVPVNTFQILCLKGKNLPRLIGQRLRDLRLRGLRYLPSLHGVPSFRKILSLHEGKNHSNVRSCCLLDKYLRRTVEEDTIKATTPSPPRKLVARPNHGRNNLRQECASSP
jgi:hypothetical protein